MKALQKYIADIYIQLDQVFTQEAQTRHEFHEQYGRYLPPGLCPALQEPPVRLRIFPEAIVTELPLLGEEPPASHIAAVETGIQGMTLNEASPEATNTTLGAVHANAAAQPAVHHPQHQHLPRDESSPAKQHGSGAASPNTSTTTPRK